MLPDADTAAGRLLRLPLRLIPKASVVTVRRGITRGMRWRVGSNTHGCWLGTYEPAKQEVVRHLVKPGMNVIDVGANAGFYTLAFASQVGDTGHVWAIEPFAENLQNLIAHVALNGLGNVTVVQAAAAARGGMAHFQAHASNSMGRLTGERTPIVVPTVSLDELCASGIPAPDVVKIDVEGGERAVLEGARGLLAARRTTWLVALDDRGTAPSCREMLAGAGHSIAEIGGDAHEIVATPQR